MLPFPPLVMKTAAVRSVREPLCNDTVKLIERLMRCETCGCETHDCVDLH